MRVIHDDEWIAMVWDKVDFPATPECYENVYDEIVNRQMAEQIQDIRDHIIDVSMR